jgi:hypothetical protein
MLYVCLELVIWEMNCEVEITFGGFSASRARIFVVGNSADSFFWVPPCNFAEKAPRWVGSYVTVPFSAPWDRLQKSGKLSYDSRMCIMKQALALLLTQEPLMT